MIRLSDQVVGDWGIFIWEQDGELYEQVKVHLLNGMTFIVDLDEFFAITDDEGW